jgi:hypothetical protein
MNKPLIGKDKTWYDRPENDLSGVYSVLGARSSAVAVEAVPGLVGGSGSVGLGSWGKPAGLGFFAVVSPC